MASPHSPYDTTQRSPGQVLPSISTLTQGLSQRTSSYSDRNTPTSNRFSNAASLNSNISYQSRRPAPTRDSGYSGTTWFDAGTGVTSKHSSLGTNNNLPFSSILNPEDDGTNPNTPSSRLNQAQPPIDKGLDKQRHTRGSAEFQSLADSRRSSVDSRVQSGFHSLALNTSLQQTSYDPRNSQASFTEGARRSGLQRPPSPSESRHSAASHQGVAKVAPPIQAASRTNGAPDPTASRPTQGFPWAFPDHPSEEAQYHAENNPTSESPPGHDMSRRTSYAQSARSGVLSMEGHMPVGQRRFEDGMAFQKIIGMTPTTHNIEEADDEDYPMQNRNVMSMQGDAAGSNYSRTPELRVSHKLAERKRRSEMKDLFEELNKAVPYNGGVKSSKWEILTKAIDYIKHNQQQSGGIQHEMSRLRTAAEHNRESRKEVEALQSEVQAMYERLLRLEPNSNHIYGPCTSQLAQQAQKSNSQAFARNGQPINTSPMQASHFAPNAAQGPSAMQGVEYGSHRE